MLGIVIISVLWIALFFKIISKLTCGWNKSNVCLTEKTAIVTGGNSGMGYEIVLGLAARGCRVIIADKDDATETIKKAIKETHNPNIVYRHIDLGSLQSIREFAANIKATEKRLHILINNAGIAATTIVMTKDGLQRTMQVNYFGPFLLTYLLTDLLKKSAPSRIIFVSSLAALINNLTVKNLNPTDDYYKNSDLSTGIYGNSKFGNIISALEFAERLKGTGVTSNTLCPGAVCTDIYANAKVDQGSFYSMNFLSLLSYLYGKTPQEGAQAALHLATANEVENVTGQFFKDCIRLWYIHPKVYNKKFRKEIWEETEKLVKIEAKEKNY